MQQPDKCLALGAGQDTDRVHLGAEGGVDELLAQAVAGVGECDVLSAAVVAVSGACDVPLVLEAVEVADEMAAVELEPVGELVLGQWSEVA